MKDYPKVREEVGSLTVDFAPGVKRSTGQSLKMVLDFGERGDVVGIEIINLLLKAGKTGLGIIDESVRTDGEGLRYSYDETSDSFYLRLKVGRSIDQKALQGSMFFDDAGRILSFSANWK